MSLRVPLMVAPVVALAPSPSLPESRKRRLDHLSWEEKVLRKKLKNRVAAQTSRDRKKAKMDEMDIRLRLLEKTNSQLLDEMRSLRKLNERLMAENDQLKKNSVSEKAVTCVVPSGSAESHPLPKEGATLMAASTGTIIALYHLAMVLFLSKISSQKLIQMNTSVISKSSLIACSQKLIEKILMEAQLNQKKSALQTDLSHQKWWGPHQSMWNPVKMKA